MKLVSFLFLMVSLVACSGETKKVLVMATGKLTVDHNKKIIKLERGTHHSEETLSFSGKGMETLTVQNDYGDQTFELPEKGLYILNLKSQDTLVGGLVNYSASAARSRLSDRELNNLIDSTRRMILGMGARDEAKTYFILPYTIKKISENFKSIVVGPFASIPYKLESEDGKLPEVYKLYTNKQQRKSLMDLYKRMKGPVPKNDMEESSE